MLVSNPTAYAGSEMLLRVQNKNIQRYLRNWRLMPGKRVWMPIRFLKHPEGVRDSRHQK